MLQTALIFQDHMILQRDKPISVWGVATPGMEVRVTLQRQKQIALAASDGAWRAVCGPFAASEAETMTVESGDESLAFTDVQIGEVWLAGGQSNMEFHMRFDLDAPIEKALGGHESIRFFDYPEVSYVGQIDEAPYRAQYGFWRKALPQELDRFSAVAYYFAREIQAKLGVPVGIIGCNWGGTPASAWMSREAIQAGGGQIFLDEYDEAVRGLDLAQYDAAFRADPTSFRVDHLEDPIATIFMLSHTIAEGAAKLAESGIHMDEGMSFMPQVGPKYPQRPAGLYESMLLPLVPYGIRGFLWYQGETDGDLHPECYEALFPALIENWRALWGEALPFLFVQLAPFEKWLDITSSSYHTIRAAQQRAADSVPGAYMAVTSDAGSRFDIHPKKKKPVGHRLALQALRHVYGISDLLSEAPRLKAIDVQAGRLTLTFDFAGEGLRLGDLSIYGDGLDPQAFSGLTIFQNGKPLAADTLRAEAHGDQVTLCSPQILSGVPTEAAIGKEDWYIVNLYNSAGIPARPGTIRA